MSNATKPARKRRFSNFLAHRNSTALGSLKFLRENKGSLNVQKIETGAFRAIFTSKATGRKAFAYGRTFNGAFQNMIRLYNLKYSSHA